MNRFSLIGLAMAALVLFAGVPAAQAQCSGYYCQLSHCPWYNHIADDLFSSGCTNWGYAGTAGVTSSNMCGFTGNQVGYISRGLYNTGGEIAQSFTTDSGLEDVYSFEYFIETTNMQPGDTVKVYVIDSQTYPPQWHLVNTITTNVSCRKETHPFNYPNWQGHPMQVRFVGNFGSTSAKAYIDYVAFWQKTD